MQSPKDTPVCKAASCLAFFSLTDSNHSSRPTTDRLDSTRSALCAVASVHCRLQQRAIDDSCGAGLNPSITSSLYYPWNRIVNYWWCCACDCDGWGREGSSCSSSRNMVHSRLCLLPSSFPPSSPFLISSFFLLLPPSPCFLHPFLFPLPPTYFCRARCARPTSFIALALASAHPSCSPRSCLCLLK